MVNEGQQPRSINIGSLGDLASHLCSSVDTISQRDPRLLGTSDVYRPQASNPEPKGADELLVDVKIYITIQYNMR